MVTDFPYLDQVIHEVLRMHPPIPRFIETRSSLYFLPHQPVESSNRSLDEYIMKAHLKK